MVFTQFYYFVFVVIKCNLCSELDSRLNDEELEGKVQGEKA